MRQLFLTYTHTKQHVAPPEPRVATHELSAISLIAPSERNVNMVVKAALYGTALYSD
jgi:hypothetical protein